MPEQFIIKTNLGDITISLYDDTPLHRTTMASGFTGLSKVS